MILFGSVTSGTLFFHNLGHCIRSRSSFIAMYLLPVKTEMEFRDRREQKERSGNNRIITVLADVTNFWRESIRGRQP